MIITGWCYPLLLVIGLLIHVSFWVWVVLFRSWCGLNWKKRQEMFRFCLAGASSSNLRKYITWMIQIKVQELDSCYAEGFGLHYWNEIPIGFVLKSLRNMTKVWTRTFECPWNFIKKIWTRSSHNADYQLWNICSNRSKDFGETSSGREQKQYKSFRSRFLFDQHHIETKAKNKPDIEAGKSYIDTHSSYGNAKSYFHTDPFSRSV